jgi:transcriptional regulator with XRE-family HTH domain
MIKISLGQRIHELRGKAGLSLRKLADQIGISSPFLSNIELGRRFPSEEILAKLAHTLWMFRRTNLSNMTPAGQSQI